MHACHVYATIKYLNLNLYYFCCPKLFHDPIRTTSSGYFMLPISEAIRDVEQTTAAHPSAKLRAPPSTTQVAQKARCLIKRRELFNNEKDSTSELYKVVAKSCNVYLSQWRGRVKIFCTQLVTVDAVDVKQSLARFSRKWRFLKNGHRSLHVLP